MAIKYIIQKDMKNTLNLRMPSILSLVILISLICSLFFTQTYFDTSNYALLYRLYEVSIVLAGIGVIIFGRCKLIFTKEELYGDKILLIPYIGLLLISIAESVIRGGQSIVNAFKTSLYPIIIIMAAVIIYKFIGCKILNILFYALVINYSFYIIAFIKLYGVKNIINFIELTDGTGIENRPLEVHEVTYIFGLLLLYYCITSQKLENKKIKIIICTLMCILGFKRILFIGLIVSLLMYYILKRNNENKISVRKITIIGTAIFSFCVLWICITSTEIFEHIANYLGIVLNGRTHNGIYGRLDGYYSISPWYIGYGVGFVQKVMEQYASTKNYFVTVGFHNDILKYYIDIGFIPWVSFFWNMIVLNMKRFFKRYNAKMFLGYMSILVMTLICWLTDNLASYPNYLFSYNIVLLALMEENSIKEKKNKNHEYCNSYRL